MKQRKTVKSRKNMKKIWQKRKKLKKKEENLSLKSKRNIEKERWKTGEWNLARNVLEKRKKEKSDAERKMKSKKERKKERKKYNGSVQKQYSVIFVQS